MMWIFFYISLTHAVQYYFSLPFFLSYNDKHMKIWPFAVRFLWVLHKYRTLFIFMSHIKNISCLSNSHGKLGNSVDLYFGNYCIQFRFYETKAFKYNYVPALVFLGYSNDIPFPFCCFAHITYSVLTEKYNVKVWIPLKFSILFCLYENNIFLS